MIRANGLDIADKAMLGDYIGIPYSKLDCQGFVEQVLKDAGVRKGNGTPYNWKGSNSMFRNHVKWRGTIEQCQKKFGCIPLGAFVFKVKHDGGELERGYHDDLGNASHVGLYVDTGICMHSQPSTGVAKCSISVFTHVCLMDMIDYTTDCFDPPIVPDSALQAIKTLRSPDSTDAECLEALKLLTKRLKEGTL